MSNSLYLATSFIVHVLGTLMMTSEVEKMFHSPLPQELSIDLLLKGRRERDRELCHKRSCEVFSPIPSVGGSGSWTRVRSLCSVSLESSFWKISTNHTLTTHFLLLLPTDKGNRGSVSGLSASLIRGPSCVYGLWSRQMEWREVTPNGPRVKRGEMKF